jgi:hypothetical protein
MIYRVVIKSSHGLSVFRVYLYNKQLFVSFCMSAWDFLLYFWTIFEVKNFLSNMVPSYFMCPDYPKG